MCIYVYLLEVYTKKKSGNLPGAPLLFISLTIRNGIYCLSAIVLEYWHCCFPMGYRQVTSKREGGKEGRRGGKGGVEILLSESFPPFISTAVLPDTAISKPV